MEDEHPRFVARLMEGESMSTRCAAFGISRKTGYKIYDRYKHWGLVGLSAREPAAASARGSDRHLKRDFPDWGAPKIRERLRRLGLGVRCPAISLCMRCWIGMSATGGGVAGIC